MVKRKSSSLNRGVTALPEDTVSLGDVLKVATVGTVEVFLNMWLSRKMMSAVHLGHQ